MFLLDGFLSEKSRDSILELEARFESAKAFYDRLEFSGRFADRGVFRHIEIADYCRYESVEMLDSEFLDRAEVVFGVALVGVLGFKWVEVSGMDSLSVYNPFNRRIIVIKPYLLSELSNDSDGSTLTSLFLKIYSSSCYDPEPNVIREYGILFQNHDSIAEECPDFAKRWGFSLSRADERCLEEYLFARRSVEFVIDSIGLVGFLPGPETGAAIVSFLQQQRLHDVKLQEMGGQG